MALNWGKINKTPIQQTTSNKTGLDWSKVTKVTPKATIPQTTQQDIETARNLMNATSTKSYDQMIGKAKQKATLDMLQQPAGVGDTTFIPQSTINDYALQDVVKKENKVADKYDSGKFVSNYTMGDIQTDLNQAYSEYSKYPTEANRLKVERLGQLEQDYMQNAQNVGKGGLITKELATHLPQQVEQLGAGAKGAFVGAFPGIVTLNPALALKGGKGGYVAGVTQYSYDQMQGGAYRDLISMGVPADIALNVSKDSALWQSLIEGAGAVGDLATLGVGKLLTTPAKTATQATAKQMLKEALKAYGYNVVSEFAEEAGQEYVGVKGEKVAMAQAGLEREATTQDDIRRVLEAGKSGATIGAIMGAGNLAGNVGTTLANNTQIRNAQQNVVPQSPQTEQTQPTNEVIPTIQQNQNTTNVAQNNANMQNITKNQPNIEQNSQDTVETNIGNIPVAEYRDIMAQQAGFNDYADMRRQGYKLGNKYDVDTIETNSKQIQNIVQNDTERFSQQVDALMNGTFDKQNMVTVLSETPNVLQQLGFNNLPITITPNKLERVINEKGKQNREYHNLGIDVVKQLPDAITNPLDIIKSHNNSVVLTTYLADKNENSVIVSIQLDGKGNINNIEIPTNVMTSAYGRNNYDNYMRKNIENGNLLYDIDRGIIKKEALNTQGLQLSNDIKASENASSTTNVPINNIIQSNENYVNSQENFALPTAEELNQPSQEMIEAAQALTLEEKQNKPKTGFMLANEGDSYKRNMFNNNAKAINDLIKAKRIVSDEFDVKIREKQQMLNSKKDKTTKVAQNLQTQIINLQKRKANAEQKFIKQIDRLENRNATINKLKKQVSEDRLPTRKEIKQDIITETDMESINLDNTKDLSKFIMNNTTPLRVNEKIFDRETAKKINDTFFRPIKTNEADRIRFLNKERSEIQSLGIEPRSEESEYVQIYGEGEWVNPDTGEATPYTLDNLKKQFPENWEKIKNAAEVIRGKYDTYLDAVNKELNKMGYDSIPKLKNYFRHFEETTSLLDQIGIPSKADHLPTDLNGLTSDLRPGKNFFANALSRTGKKTTYDAITGIDGYLEGVSKLMYHTEDIQKLRTFDEYIRDKYGKNADLEGLNKQEFAEKVEQIQEGHLSEYAAWLSEYTNALAGKKSKMDRGTEEALGRRIYGTLNAVKKQVGSNLTGLNLNSALSNFISITQGASKTSKLAMLEGLEDTLKNIFIDDGFINKSDFLTRRFGSDKLSKTTWEKMSNAGQIFMSGTDYFSANLITRSKYHEYLNKGYSENEAIKLADEFADRLMGGRALGDMPNIFNSKTLGILTQFQLENVNQFDSMFHDTKYEDRAAEQTKYEAKTWNEKLKSKLAKEKPEFYNSLSATLILGQLFAYAWAYNKVDEELTGSGGAFDPIGIIEDLIKDFTNPNLSKGQAVANLAKNVIDVIPYANILTGGGRVPMTDAIPNIVDLLEGESNLGSELWKVANLALPTGGGQLRKTAQAAGALVQGGDYKTNANGEKQLKFPIAQEGNVAQRIAEGAQALLFGKWATPGGKKYIEDGFKPLSAVETEGLERAQEMDIGIKEFYDIMESIEELEIPKRKNKEGKEESVPGARKKLIKEELNSRKELTDEQRKLLYDIFYKREL
jgi:hypothetical protein